MLSSAAAPYGVIAYCYGVASRAVGRRSEKLSCVPAVLLVRQTDAF